MNVRRLTAPLLIALGVSALCTLALSRKINTHAVQPVAMSSYVTVGRPLGAGEVIKAEDLRMISWPAANAVAGGFTKPDGLAGRAVLYPVDANQPLTEKALSAVGAGFGLAGRIPDGMRAIALKSDEVMGVAGFLLPGSHLDVLVTYRTEKSPEMQTVTVLQDAEVIAAGHQIAPDPEGKPATVTVVTLLLTPQDAERAVLASTQGTIHFVLRSGSDKAKTHDDGIALSELGGGTRTAAISVPAPVAVERTAPVRVTTAKVQTVETISGDKQVTATFEEGGR